MVTILGAKNMEIVQATVCAVAALVLLMQMMAIRPVITTTTVGDPSLNLLIKKGEIIEVNTIHR